MIEVARDQVLVTAARMWAALPSAERENTLRGPVEPRVPDLPLPEKEITLEM